MIVNRQRAVRVSALPLRRFLARVQRTLRLPNDAVAVCLIEDSEMARLNRTYRGQRGPTDVLSFPVARPPAPRAKRARQKGADHFLGDIAISPAAARRNATAYARTLAEELPILILHGVLHLLGYDHETDHGEMQRYEMRLRRRLGLAP